MTSRRRIPLFVAGLAALSVVFTGALTASAATPSDGTPDTVFNATFATGGGFDQYPSDMATQSDGKIVITGTFTTVDGGPAPRIVRLNPDGSRDFAFSAALAASGDGSGFNAETSSVAIQADGKILIAGSFTQINGLLAGGLVRLNADGSVDLGFLATLGAGANSSVRSIALQSDQSIVAVGSFTEFDNLPAGSIVRLDASGIRDFTFAPVIGTGLIQSVYVDSTDRVLLAGPFTTYGSSPTGGLVRLSSAGVFDTAFDLALRGAGDGSGLSAQRPRIAGVQSTGGIIVTGWMDTINGVPLPGVFRVSDSGAYDPIFSATLSATGDGSGFTNVTWDGVVQSDGKVVVSGEFTSLGGIGTSFVLRLAADGTFDPSFTSALTAGGGGGFSGFGAYTISADAEERLLVGGYIFSLNGATLGGLARLETNLPSQVVTWAPTTSVTTANSPLTPSSAATSDGDGAISYAVTSAGTTGCTVNATTGVLTFTADGTCTVTATAAATANFKVGSTAVAFQIAKQPQTVTWTPSNPLLIAASPYTPPPATDSGAGAISYSVTSAGTTGCTVNATTGVLTYAALGTCAVQATAAATSSYAAGSTTVAFSIVNPTQVVTWAPTNTTLAVGASPVTPSAPATSNGNGAISYAVAAAGGTGCSVNATTGELTFTGAGTCSVTATAAATSTFQQGSTTVNFTIASALAITGAGLVPAGWLAALLLLVGGALVIARRRETTMGR